MSRHKGRIVPESANSKVLVPVHVMISRDFDDRFLGINRDVDETCGPVVDVCICSTKPDLRTQARIRVSVDTLLTTIYATLGIVEPQVYDSVDEALKAFDPKRNTSKRQKISDGLRFRVMRRDKYRCQLCGVSAGSGGVEMEVDHKVPVAKGGATIFENLWLLCKPCNRGKTDHDLYLSEGEK